MNQPHPALAATHEVLNQAPPLENWNPYECNHPLQEVLEREGAGAAAEWMRARGAELGSPQMLEWKMVLQGLPRISSLCQPVMCSAALLKEVRFQFRSTVKTPSAMLSRMRSCCRLDVTSRKVSTPPITWPSGSTSGEALMLMGMVLPFFPLI